MYNIYEITIEKASELLKQNELKKPFDIDYTIGVHDSKKLVATGSVGGRVIKGLAVDKEYQGQTLLNKVVSELIIYALRNGYHDTFIFTKYKYKRMIECLGFKEIISVNNTVSLLERSPKGIQHYKKLLALQAVEAKGTNVALVMNCNPFTLGHQYLVERAASENTNVFLFVVEEDKSLFPFETRMDLVKKGVSHLDNVTVISGGRYIISSATFPSYFTEDEERDATYAHLDAAIFGRHIAPILNIKKRYIGTEPFCSVTRQYNKVLESVLSKYDIQVVEVERRSNGEQVISASKIRKLIEINNVEETLEYVPNSTYVFLKSDAMKVILDNNTNLNYVNSKK